MISVHFIDDFMRTMSDGSRENRAVWGKRGQIQQCHVQDVIVRALKSSKSATHILDRLVSGHGLDHPLYYVCRDNGGVRIDPYPETFAPA